MDISSAAEPVSTCVHEIFAFSHRFLFCYKIENATLPSLFPGYQFCTVEYLISGVQRRLIPLLRHAAGFRHDSVRCSLQVTYVTSFICNQQGSLKLSCSCLVDSEISESSIGQRTPLGI
jgi:hypothetical protein